MLCCDEFAQKKTNIYVMYKWNDIACLVWGTSRWKMFNRIFHMRRQKPKVPERIESFQRKNFHMERVKWNGWINLRSEWIFVKKKMNCMQQACSYNTIEDIWKMNELAWRVTSAMWTKQNEEGIFVLVKLFISKIQNSKDLPTDNTSAPPNAFFINVHQKFF